MEYPSSTKAEQLILQKQNAKCTEPLAEKTCLVSEHALGNGSANIVVFRIENTTFASYGQPVIHSVSQPGPGLLGQPKNGGHVTPPLPPPPCWKTKGKTHVCWKIGRLQLREGVKRVPTLMKWQMMRQLWMMLWRLTPLFVTYLTLFRHTLELSCPPPPTLMNNRCFHNGTSLDSDACKL